MHSEKFTSGLLRRMILRGQLSLQAGDTTNANYGPRNPVVPLAPGASVPYLLLQTTQLAQADRFAGMDGSVNWGTGGVEGLNVSAGASIRRCARRHDYSQDCTSLAVHYVRDPTKVGLNRGIGGCMAVAPSTARNAWPSVAPARRMPLAHAFQPPQNHPPRSHIPRDGRRPAFRCATSFLYSAARLMPMAAAARATWPELAVSARTR